MADFFVCVLQMLWEFSMPFSVNKNPFYPAYEINVLIFHNSNYTFKLKPFFRKLERDHVF